MTDGWIKLHRKLQDNPIWTAEPFTKGQAWADLLLMANHIETSFTIRGIWVTVKSGQIARGEEYFAKRWRWSRNKFRRFLIWLETEQQIKQQKSHLITVISIVNWEWYQGNGVVNGTINGTTDGTTERQQKNIYKNVKNIKEVNTNAQDCVNSDFDTLSAFEVVWKKYPRRLGRKAAYRHFAATVKTAGDLERIKTSLLNYLDHIDSEKIEPRFIQHGATWFNNWQDWENYKHPEPKRSNVA
jgi:hypothetical protein